MENPISPNEEEERLKRMEELNNICKNESILENLASKLDLIENMIDEGKEYMVELTGKVDYLCNIRDRLSTGHIDPILENSESAYEDVEEMIYEGRSHIKELTDKLGFLAKIRTQVDDDLRYEVEKQRKEGTLNLNYDSEEEEDVYFNELNDNLRCSTTSITI